LDGGLTRWFVILGVVRSPRREVLGAMIAAATVDCYDDSECVTGYSTMLDERLAMLFQACVLGVDVTVTGIDLADGDQIVGSALVVGGASASAILDLLLPVPALEGTRRVKACRHWLK
jgi:hypothetical protein